MRAAVVRRVQHVDVAGLDAPGVLADHGLDRLAHRAEVHRHVRRVGDQVARAVEDRTGKVEPLLDVHRVRRVLQPKPHLLGDRHEEIVEDLEPDRIDLGADRARGDPRARALEHQVIELGDARPPFRLHYCRGIRLRDDRRPIDALPGAQRLAPIERCLAPFAAGEHAHFLHGACRRAPLSRPLLRCISGRDRFHRHRLGHQRAARHQERELLAVGRLELSHHCLAIAELHDERGIRAVIFQVHALLHQNAAGGHALELQFVSRLRGQLFRNAREWPSVIELQLDRALAHGRLVGKAHAVSREHARVRVDEDPRHAERVRDETGVLAGGATEAAERISRHVVPALHRDVLDRVRHVAHRDLHEPFGDRLFGPAILDVARQCLEFLAYHRRVEWLVALQPEDLRKEGRLDFAEHHVGVGHSERSAAPIAGRPRISPRRVRADAVARAVEMQDRATARCHRMDRHHRRAHAHLPWKRRASVRPPFDCMKKSRTPPNSAATWLT